MTSSQYIHKTMKAIFEWVIRGLVLNTGTASCFSMAAINPLLPALDFYLRSNLTHKECLWFPGLRARQQYLRPADSHPHRHNNSRAGRENRKNPDPLLRSHSVCCPALCVCLSVCRCIAETQRSKAEVLTAAE